MQVIKHEYKTVLVKSDNLFRLPSQQDDKIMHEQEISVLVTSTAYSYIPRSPGNLKYAIYRPGANAYVSKSFYSYGAWGSSNSTFEVNNEGNIDIQLDKQSYQAGENARLLFKRLLVDECW